MQRITPSYCLINEVAPTVNRTQIATATTWSTNHYTMEANVHFSKNGTYNIYFWPIFRRENNQQNKLFVTGYNKHLDYQLPHYWHHNHTTIIIDYNYLRTYPSFLLYHEL